MTTALAPARHGTGSVAADAPGRARPAAWVHVVRRALGTSTRITVLAASEAVAQRVADLSAPILERIESRWSRFRPTSELSLLNRAAGNPVVVSDETYDAVAHAVEAWRRTDGRFDPTVLPSLLALGYDRDFRAVAPDGPRITPASPAPGCAGIALDPLVRSVTLPPGVSLDLGGIGKGLAADRLAGELLAAGASGVSIDLGGDVRVAGDGPHRGAWSIDIDDPLATGDTGSVVVADGAVATSTRLVRAWRRGGRRVHHLVDPATGDCTDNGLASVTVLASETWWAEVLAKAAFVAGPRAGVELLADAGVTGLLVHGDGRVTELAGLRPFRR